MKKINLGSSEILVPTIAVGCMRINELESKKLDEYLRFCIENELNFFDHADIYGRGECEKNFGESIKRLGISRENLIIQSKCGIVPGKMYDFSKEHILKSVDQILRRLGTEYLDLLVLHRPDALVEPEEVAETFTILKNQGKVREFGVSNHKPSQIELLKKYFKQSLLVNQLQFSLPFSNMIANGLEVNMLTDGSFDRDSSILDYCRINDITIQAWSPFQYGFFEGVFIGDKKYSELNKVLEELADKYDVTPTSIATAWILRHPANIQMIAGTTKISRMQEIIQGSKIKLSREEWYKLYLSAGHILP